MTDNNNPLDALTQALYSVLLDQFKTIDERVPVMGQLEGFLTIMVRLDEFKAESEKYSETELTPWMESLKEEDSALAVAVSMFISTIYAISPEARRTVLLGIKEYREGMAARGEGVNGE